MAVTPSNMLELGTKLPEFELLSTEHERISGDKAFGDNGLLVCFICNHCPFVIHVAHALAELGRDFDKMGIGVVGINSNDAKNYPEDSFDRMIDEKKNREYPFAYLIDETQEVAKSFQAACTPDFYLFSQDRSLFYRGRMDESRPGNQVEPSGNDLRAAAELMLTGKPSPSEQHPSMGCNIKWLAR